MLNAVFWSVSFIATALAFVFCAELSAVWVILMPLCIYFGLLFVYLLSLFVASLFFGNRPVEKTSPVCRFFVWLSMDWLMSFFRVRITLKGKELLPRERMVLVSNHVSDFDPMVVLAVLRRKIAFISKESNFKIPIVGPFIRKAGFLAIDRENALRAMRTLKKASELMAAENLDMGIYPEGTRSKTGELLEFKTGAFVLAKRSKAPVVILSPKGTDRIAHNIPFRSTKVELHVLEVLPPQRVAEMSLDELSAYVKGRIAEELGQTVVPSVEN